MKKESGWNYLTLKAETVEEEVFIHQLYNLLKLSDETEGVVLNDEQNEINFHTYE